MCIYSNMQHLLVACGAASTVHACTHLPPSVGPWRVLGPKDHEVGMGLHCRLCLSDEQLTVVIQHLAHQEEKPTELVDESQPARGGNKHIAVSEMAGQGAKEPHILQLVIK